MPNYTKQLGNVKPGTRAVALEVCAAVERAGLGTLTQLWGWGPNPDHNNARCVDFMCNRAQGDFIADYLWKNRSRLGVKWIIWRQRIRSTTPGKGDAWRGMADRGNSTANHMDHVHLETTGAMPKGTATPATAAAATVRKCSSTYIRNAARNDPPKTGTPVHPLQGPSVLVMEQALHKLGYLAAAQVDGHYGTATIEAAKKHQAKASKGIKPDGVLGPKELTALFREAGMNVQVHP